METRFFCHFALLSICIHRNSANKAEITSNLVRRDLNNAATTENTAIATTVQSIRKPRYYRRGYNGGEDDMSNDHYEHDMDAEDPGDMKAVTQAKTDYWSGYYDFLINEGSYKFWAVFQLATAALLIYSAFAALYYAKVNPQTSDDYFEDYLVRRRRRRSFNQSILERPFMGLDSGSFQRILDAIAKEFH